MDISIIIINYNTFALTCQCIESILEKSKDVTYEIILVDNASTECDPQHFKDKFPAIVLIKSLTNLGFSRGNNLGIREAKGKYILLFNSDAQFKNNVLYILFNFIKDKPAVAAVSARLEYPDGTLQHNCQRFQAISYKLFELFRLQKFLPRSIGGKILFGSFFDYNTVAYPDWIWGTCFMFRKTILQELPEGKLADDFFMYGEDVQWCMEFKRRGYRVAFVPSAVVIHFMGKSGGDKHTMMAKNMEILIDKYYGPWKKRCLKFLDRLLS